MNLLTITNTTIARAGGVAILAAASQTVGYYSTAPAQRTSRRTVALGLGLAAAYVSLVIGWNAIDWGNLPTSSGAPGTPYSNGGEVAISPKPR
jgi:hypothetical protein